MKQKIYRVPWERYDDEGCFEVFYTNWHTDKEVVESHRKELLNLSLFDRSIAVNKIECDELILDNNLIPLANRLAEAVLFNWKQEEIIKLAKEVACECHKIIFEDGSN